MSKRTLPYQALSYPLPLGFNGRLAGMYRWFSGRPLNGHRYTDATGFRYGTMSTDLSGRATTYQLLPGYKRFLYARLPVMLAPAVAVTGVLEPLPLAWTAAIGATLTVPKVAGTVRHRRFRRAVVEPVAASVSAVLKQRHVSGMGHTWVTVPEDYRDNPEAVVSIRLPMSWSGDTGDRTRLLSVVQDRLQVEELSPVWTLSGAVPSVSFRVPPKPSTLVSWDSGVHAAVQAKDTAPVLGLGVRDKVESFDLALESPHLLIAGGSGAGKSELIAWLVAQFMRRGYGVLCLDAKFISHMWLRQVPGVHYAAEDEELHNALIWLDAELLRRARLVASGGDPAGLVPLVAVLEEMNGATNRLRAYWKSIKQTGDPAMSPALTALMNLASMGRELRVHIIMAGQSLTAKAVGGPETRENFGGRMFGRATAAQWRMLAPQIKRAPLKRAGPGRWHIVVGETVRELQVPFVDLKHESARLIEWATGAADVPDVNVMMIDFPVPVWGEGGGEEAHTASSEPPTPAGISLRAFAEEYEDVDLKTLLRWRERRDDFPTWVGIGARGVQLFERGHLVAYVRERRREPAA